MHLHHLGQDSGRHRRHRGARGRDGARPRAHDGCRMAACIHMHHINRNLYVTIIRPRILPVITMLLHNFLCTQVGDVNFFLNDHGGLTLCLCDCKLIDRFQLCVFRF